VALWDGKGRDWEGVGKEGIEEGQRIDWPKTVAKTLKVHHRPRQRRNTLKAHKYPAS